MLDLTDWQNQKYTTRGGTAVRILCIDGPGKYPVVGVWLDKKGDVQIPPTWTINGEYLIGSKTYQRQDLINAKTKREKWVNVYKGAEDGHYATLYKSKSGADLNASKYRTACVKIEWEE